MNHLGTPNIFKQNFTAIHLWRTDLRTNIAITCAMLLVSMLQMIISHKNSCQLLVITEEEPYFEDEKGSEQRQTQTQVLTVLKQSLLE